MHTARLRKPKEAKLGQAERRTGPLTPEHAAQTTRGVVLRDGDLRGGEASSTGVPCPWSWTGATRARTPERFESATRRTHASAPMPAG
jgi:hypothetical protein